MRYLETGSVDPAYNLAFEETVLQTRRQGDYLILWQNDRTVVIGRNQNAEAEIDRAFVERHGIHVVRRITGGGAVYHDLGNLNYSFITDEDSAAPIAFARFARPVVAALAGLGVRAEATGRNDILVDGRKVSGTAQRILHGRVLHHGTLLFDADPGMVSGALRVDPLKFQSKSTQSVRARIGNIRPCLPADMDLPAFWAYLKDALAGDGLQPDALSAAELASVEQLRRTRYDTWAWNFGASPPYGHTVKRKWAGGILESHLQVTDGCITACVFYGDFLARRPLHEVTDALLGCPFRQTEVTARLGKLPLSDYFGSITQSELLTTLFETETPVAGGEEHL